MTTSIHNYGDPNRILQRLRAKVPPRPKGLKKAELLRALQDGAFAAAAAEMSLSDCETLDRGESLEKAIRQAAERGLDGDITTSQFKVCEIGFGYNFVFLYFLAKLGFDVTAAELTEEVGTSNDYDGGLLINTLEQFPLLGTINLRFWQLIPKDDAFRGLPGVDSQPRELQAQFDLVYTINPDPDPDPAEFSSSYARVAYGKRIETLALSAKPWGMTAILGTGGNILDSYRNQLAKIRGVNLRPIETGTTHALFQRAG